MDVIRWGKTRVLKNDGIYEEPISVYIDDENNDVYIEIQESVITNDQEPSTEPSTEPSIESEKEYVVV